MRSEDEIQKRHDILVQLLLDQELFDMVVAKQSQPDVQRYCDVLCWLLEHKHNPTFDLNFQQVVARLELLGCGIFKYPTLQNTEKE